MLNNENGIHHNIEVDVQTCFLPEQSQASKQRFMFAYTITISNWGNEPARLLRRHWIITDANGHTQEIYGEGVVGEKPLIPPGHSYHYSSAAMLPTPVGSMHGSYLMITQKGVYFNAPIPPFRLAIKQLVH